jgi:hypothetical protein
LETAAVIVELSGFLFHEFSGGRQEVVFGDVGHFVLSGLKM